MPFDRDPFDVPPRDRVTANPYSPTSNVGSIYSGTTDVDAIEAYRKAHLKHEASIQSIGTLYLLGTIFMAPVGLAMLLGGIGVLAEPQGRDVSAALFAGAIGLGYFMLGAFQGYVGWGLRKLKHWARTPAIVLSVIGLLAIPIGTMISIYFLYLLLSEKGKIIMSPPYQDVIAQTPHIKYRMSIVIWILLGLVVALIAVGIVGVVAARP